MKLHELTERVPAATSLHMQDHGGTGRRSGRRGIAAAVLVAGAVALGGCITVSAPDKPIVIELNINIKQEVVYRLAQDAEQTVKDNEGIF